MGEDRGRFGRREEGFFFFFFFFLVKTRQSSSSRYEFMQAEHVGTFSSEADPLLGLSCAMFRSDQRSKKSRKSHRRLKITYLLFTSRKPKGARGNMIEYIAYGYWHHDPRHARSGVCTEV